MEQRQKIASESAPIPKRPPILRVLAWSAVLLLGASWVSLGLSWTGLNFPHTDWIFLGSLAGAFVVGISSCERLGGVCAGLATVTVLALLNSAGGG